MVKSNGERRGEVKKRMRSKSASSDVEARVVVRTDPSKGKLYRQKQISLWTWECIISYVSDSLAA